MQIIQEQYEKIAKYLPTQRGNVNMTNLQLISAILYVTEISFFKYAVDQGPEIRLDTPSGIKDFLMRDRLVENARCHVGDAGDA